MSELFEQLGINWKLFLSQAVNFFILLFVLRLFVYKPVLEILGQRSEKIKDGLEKAEEASLRLKEVDVIASGRLKDAENKSISIIKGTEEKAKALEDELRKKAESRQKMILEQMEASRIRQQEEANVAVLKEAAGLVKSALLKTVELSPEDVDDALIEKAVNTIHQVK